MKKDLFFDLVHTPPWHRINESEKTSIT